MNTIGSELKDRAALKNLFINGTVPSEQDFEELINSVVVKRDDQFFGLWQKGAGYRVGDTVLYSDTAGKVGIYVFVSAQLAEAMAKAQGKDCDCLDDDCCGNKPPGECCRWQLLHVDTDDHDWRIVQEGTNAIMYAEVVGKLGVGTQAPEAFFHLYADREGPGSQLLFNPTGSACQPCLRLKSDFQAEPLNPEGALFVEQKICLNDTNTSAEWLTNVPLGYVFRKQTSAGAPREQTQEVLLLVIGSDEGNRPRIGIGIQEPQAALEVTQANNSIRLDTDETDGPQLILLKTAAKGNTLTLNQALNDQYVKWTTNTLYGFLFAAEADKPLVVFNANGNVGIGTTTPANKLEVVANNGRFSFDVESADPMLTVTNLKEDGGEINLNLSVNFTTTVLETDAQNGFEFRQKGARILSLSRDTNARTPTFSAQIDGFAHTNGLYVRSLEGEDVGPLKSGLDFLRTLEPQERPAAGDNHIQMGFVFTRRTGRSSKIAKQFPDNTFGIAQHNLIAMLVRSVQELKDQIDDLQEQVNVLKQNQNTPGTV